MWYGLMHADYNSLFDSFDPLVLALYMEEFIIPRSLEQLMLWCKKILTSEVDMKDVGAWQVADEVFLVQGIYTLNILKRFQSAEGSSDPGLYFFKFIDGPHGDEVPSRGEV